MWDLVLSAPSALCCGGKPELFPPFFHYGLRINMITVFKHQRYNYVMKRRMSLSNVNRHAGRTSVAVPGSDLLCSGRV